MFKSNTTEQKWIRVRNTVRFMKEGDGRHIVLEHSVDSVDDRITFAFTYPYSYTMCQNDLQMMDMAHENRWTDPLAIYYRRELLTRSLDGRRVDLITISSMEGISAGSPRSLSRWRKRRLSNAG